jgi:signal transduction histidine kinase
MNYRKIRGRLLIGYFLFGTLNFLVISVFMYGEFKNALIQKSQNHLLSVSSLINQKLNDYFDGLKKEAFISLPLMSQSPTTSSVCYKKGNQWMALKGSCESARDNTSEGFYFIDEYHFGMSMNHHGVPYFLSFTQSGLTKILEQRAGLGESGEVYLVGRDKKIKSATRFLDNWEHVTLHNESVMKGLKGETGTSIVRDYRDVEVISSHTLFKKDHIELAVLSEIDVSEVLKPIHPSLFAFLSLGLCLIILNILAAIFMTKKTIQLFVNMRKQIQELSLQNINAQETERERIAHDLHDGIGQLLTALKWELSRLGFHPRPGVEQEKFIDLEKLTEKVIQEVRIISNDITPTSLKEFGWVLAIEQYLNQQEKILKLKTEFHAEGELEKITLSWKFQLNIYRLLQELVHNTYKHAQAEKIQCHLKWIGNEIVMLYSDDGIGMGHEALYPRSIQYRVQLFNGVLIHERTTRGVSYRISFKQKDFANE